MGNYEPKQKQKEKKNSHIEKTFHKKFLPVLCCPKSIKIALKIVFSCAMLSGTTRTTLHKVSSVQCCRGVLRQHYTVVPGVLRQHCTGIFHVQCCLEPLAQYCTGFLPV